MSPLRISTSTKGAHKAYVFAECDKRYYGAAYISDLVGWTSLEWHKPHGNYLSNGKENMLDIEIEHKVKEYHAT